MKIPLTLGVCQKKRKMENYLAILQALTWASSRCNYSDVKELDIKRLQEVRINFEETPASNIEPFKYENGGTEMLSFVYTSWYQSTITIAPARPFIVYMYEGESLLGTESNCSKEVVDFLRENKQIQAISFNVPQVRTKDQNTKVDVRNKMSARELIIKQNAPLNFVENIRTHRLQFNCGNIKGYVSPTATKFVEQGEIDDFWYAEVSRNRGPYVPCIMYAKKITRLHDEPLDDLPF